MNIATTIEMPVIPPLDPALFVDVDMFGQAIKADPTPWFRQWADKPPFYVTIEGHTHVVLCRHEHVKWALTNHDVISAVPHKGWGTDQFDYFNGLPLVLDFDPPEHSRMRRLMAPGFTPKQVNRLQPTINAMVDGLIEQVRAKGRFDMIDDFSGPLMYSLLLGGVFEFPQEDWPIFINLSNALELVATVPEGAPKPQKYLDAFNACHDYVGQLIEERRLAPKDDLIGGVIAAHDEAGKLSTEELFSTLVQLFTGGLGTVIATSTNCMNRLLRNPDQLQMLRDDMSLLNGAIEECLRVDSLGNFRHRFVVQEHVIDGVPIYPGMVAHMSLGCANFDPDVYPDPFRFDITRDPRNIMTFGYGAHFCPGNVLARSVLRTIIGKLITAFPNIRLADPDETIVYGGMPTERFPLHVNVQVD